MIIGFIFALLCWFITQKIWLTIVVFYIITGIRKTIRWTSLPNGCIPMVYKKNFTSFFLCTLIWPIIMLANGGDPYYDNCYYIINRQYTKNHRKEAIIADHDREKPISNDNFHSESPIE